MAGLNLPVGVCQGERLGGAFGQRLLLTDQKVETVAPG